MFLLPAPAAVLTEHQLFDVFNNAIVSLYRSERVDGEDSGIGGAGGSGGSSDSSRGGGSSNGSRGAGGTGNENGVRGQPEGGAGNNNSPSGNEGRGGGAGTMVSNSGMTTNDALLFHEKCGTLIKLSNNNKTAERRRPLDEFNNGVVMTNRPLRHNEMFEVCVRACMCS